MTQRTPLYDTHIAAAARMTDFAGWEMPLHYGSQLSEHHAVRQKAGVFDVSHMGIIDFTGTDVPVLMQRLLANDTARLTDGRGLYSCLLNAQGGILDDLLAFRVHSRFFRLVVNAATRTKDLAWFFQQAAGLDLQLHEQPGLAMLALQGPQVRENLAAFFPGNLHEKIAHLRPFEALSEDEWFVSRTGYTGEDGLEIMLPAESAADFWQTLVAAGVVPCGLGARDTLRLEAGLNLYGQDMDETLTPAECGLAWTVVFSPGREFIGRTALKDRETTSGLTWKRIGLTGDARTIFRAEQTISCAGSGEGRVTSGGFSPTLGVGIALARVPASMTCTTCDVVIRGKKITATPVRPPFVRQGKSCLQPFDGVTT